MKIRKIEITDNEILKGIVTQSIDEFNVDPSTTIVGDPTLGAMYQNYRFPRAVYYIVEIDNVIVGGCGIKQLDGTSENICELQRMFLKKEVRGKGIGKKLMDLCLESARSFNYDRIYLETLADMTIAISLYRSYGFQIIFSPFGSTGHSGCNIYMIRDL